jgi:nucleoside-diphosphate-sugar epimerase
MYVVTGGGGFIGSHIARALVRQGQRVRIFDNGMTGGPQRLADVLADIEWIADDLRDSEALQRAFAGVEVVFHQAAVASVPRSIAEPTLAHAINLTGTLNVLDAACRAGVRRVVYASSSAVYGVLPGSPKSEAMPVEPLSPYAAQKLAGEHYCRIWQQLHGLETVSLRYFNVYGPGQDPQSEYAAVIPKFITTVLRGDTPTVFGDGEQSRDFIYIEDIVNANLRAAMQSEAVGHVFNVGTGGSSTLNQLLAELARITGREIHPNYTDARPGDVRESLADISLLKAILGYQPTVPFGTGLERTVAAFATSDPT